METLGAHDDRPAVEAAVRDFLPNPSERLVALRQLLDSARHADIVAPGAWGVSLFGNGFRLNVGNVEVLVATADGIRLNCAGKVGEAPFVGDRFLPSTYRSLPDPKCAFVGPVSEFAQQAPGLQQAHRQFIELAGRRRDGMPVSGSPHRRSHTATLLNYAADYLADPEMADTATDFVPVDDELLPSGGWVEGGRLVRDITEYERSAAARAKCLEHYGATCVACGFSAGAVYGELVGQIVHVHHLRPLSEIGDRYAVDPVRDLRPVCPNCHAAIHARVPPFSIDEVRSMLNARSRKGAY